MRKLKFLLILFALLFISHESLAQTFVFSKNRLLKVASGTFAAANARTSYVAGTGFVDANGTDFSAYAGTDLGSTPYKVCLTDASGDKAWGYLGAVGGGEDVTDIVGGTDPALNNGDFSAGDTGWTKEAGWTIAGGVGVATTVPSGNDFYQTLPITVVGTLYKGSVDVVRTSGTMAFAPLYTVVFGTANTTKTISGYGVVVTASTRQVSNYAYSSVFTGTVDNIVYQQVTDCAVTGLHVMSAKNGTIRNWQSIGATFGYNDAMSWTIYKAY